LKKQQLAKHEAEKQCWPSWEVFKNNPYLGLGAKCTAMNFVCKTLLQNAGPMAVEHEAMQHRVGLWAAYVFTIAGFTSLCLYWCIQRCFYGWAAFIYKIEHTPLGYRDVEDLFLELTQQCCPSVPCILRPLSL
jgi:hypothetical protein